MNTVTDYYRVLQVRPDAPPELIETSYQMLSRSLAARGADVDSSRVDLLREAYRVLSNPQARARYDERLRSHDGGHAMRSKMDKDCCLFCGAHIPPGPQIDNAALCPCCASPLARATRHRFEHSMRRLFRRIDRRQRIEIYSQWGSGAIAGAMTNLSLNGMRYTSDQEFITNQLIKIDSDMCKALARVCYSRRDDSGEFVTGVEFVTILFLSMST